MYVKFDLSIYVFFCNQIFEYLRLRISCGLNFFGVWNFASWTFFVFPKIEKWIKRILKISCSFLLCFLKIFFRGTDIIFYRLLGSLSGSQNYCFRLNSKKIKEFCFFQCTIRLCSSWVLKVDFNVRIFLKFCNILFRLKLVKKST